MLRHLLDVWCYLGSRSESECGDGNGNETRSGLESESGLSKIDNLGICFGLLAELEGHLLFLVDFEDGVVLFEPLSRDLQDVVVSVLYPLETTVWGTRVLAFLPESIEGNGELNRSAVVSLGSDSDLLC